MLVKLSEEPVSRGIAFLGVNTIDALGSVMLTVKRPGLRFPIACGGGAQMLKTAVKVNAYPVTDVIDAKCRIEDAIQSVDENGLRVAIALLQRGSALRSAPRVQTQVGH